MTDTPYKRYKRLEKTLLDLYGMVDVMYAAKVYGAEEMKSFMQLSHTLGRAMLVLDPERAKPFMIATQAEFLDKYFEPVVDSAQVDAGPAEQVGQYL